eukprot:GHVS01083089.1.p2 GENE.GHVS01083089.1~~GHVS01083089.1.p2  ORF type:complete len:113 (+),score=11.74 GHVS01083089.1:637-975(+)
MKYALKGKMETQMYYARIGYLHTSVAAAVSKKRDGTKWLSVAKLQTGSYVHRSPECITDTTTKDVLRLLRVATVSRVSRDAKYIKAVDEVLKGKGVLYKWRNSKFIESDNNP